MEARSVEVTASWSPVSEPRLFTDPWGCHMKTVFYVGGSVLVDDATADAVIGYSRSLAGRRQMDTVTLTDHTPSEAFALVVLTVGLGVPLAVRSPASPTHVDVGTDIQA